MILRALALALALVVGSAANVEGSTSFNAYRSTAFSTQATMWYCTAAVEQMIWNTATGRSNHGYTQQHAFYAYGRAHNRYAYSTRGVDPQGVAATLRHYVPQGDWHWYRSTTMQGALRAAADRVKATGLPAVIFVGGGSHVWTLHGFTRDDSGRVTYVRFSGPLYPKQVAYNGWYDLAPNTRKPVSALGGAFFPYRERLAFGDTRWTPWNGYYVVVIP